MPLKKQAGRELKVGSPNSRRQKKKKEEVPK
jgi:hypothetical protein